MTTRQAAEIIGCTIHQVRHLIRTGVLTATKEPDSNNQHGYRLWVHVAPVKHYAKTKQTRGYPRGKKRK